MILRNSIVVKTLFLAVCVTGAAHGWWDHPCITRAAWDALPRELTAEYSHFERDELCYHTMMSDYPRMKTAGDFGYFQLWDIFMWRQRRPRVGYENGGGNDIDFARLMQSARTETALNTFLTAGCMLHGIEDQMSISHTVLPGPYQAEWHAPCEQFADWRKYSLKGYAPKPIAEGYDAEAIDKACMARIKEVNGGAAALWTKIKPIIDENGIKQKPETKRRTNERIDPYVRDFAKDAGKVVADVLYTLLSARREFAANKGAALEGLVSAPHDPLNEDRSAKVYLRTVDGAPTDYETMAFDGRFAFRNLPAGEYRLAATRLGAEFVLSEAFSLATGRTTRVDIALKASEPLGNQVWNPTGKWDLYGAGSPDRWRMKPLFDWGPLQQDYWRTSFMHLEPGWAYRFGAKLKRAGVEVRLRTAKGYGGHGPANTLEFEGGALESECVWINDEDFLKAKIEVASTEPLTNLIEKVWLVPIPPRSWKPGTPRTDYVPLDDGFRTSLHCEPPQPEFWQRGPEKEEEMTRRFWIAFRSEMMGPFQIDNVDSVEIFHTLLREANVVLDERSGRRASGSFGSMINVPRTFNIPSMTIFRTFKTVAEKLDCSFDCERGHLGIEQKVVSCPSIPRPLLNPVAVLKSSRHDYPSRRNVLWEKSIEASDAKKIMAAFDRTKDCMLRAVCCEYFLKFSDGQIVGIVTDDEKRVVCGFDFGWDEEGVLGVDDGSPHKLKVFPQVLKEDMTADDELQKELYAMVARYGCAPMLNGAKLNCEGRKK